MTTRAANDMEWLTPYTAQKLGISIKVTEHEKMLVDIGPHAPAAPQQGQGGVPAEASGQNFPRARQSPHGVGQAHGGLTRVQRDQAIV